MFRMYLTRSEYLDWFWSSRTKACWIRIVFATESIKFDLALSRYWVTSSSSCRIFLNSLWTLISFVPLDLYFLTLGGSGIFLVLRLMCESDGLERESVLYD